MTWQDRITVNPSVCHGKACICGTSVMRSVLDDLAAVQPIEIMRRYHIEREDVQATPPSWPVKPRSGYAGRGLMRFKTSSKSEDA